MATRCGVTSWENDFLTHRHLRTNCESESGQGVYLWENVHPEESAIFRAATRIYAAKHAEWKSAGTTIK